MATRIRAGSSLHDPVSFCVFLIPFSILQYDDKILKTKQNKTRFPATDEVSIRDGLVYIMTGFVNGDSLQALRGPESMRGHALSCALFSGIAIGGLLHGCPPANVACHVEAARRSLEKFRGLADRFTVAALVLFAMCTVMSNNATRGPEYVACVLEARKIFDSLPEKDPLMVSLFAQYTIMDGFQHFTFDDCYSVNPINALVKKSCVRADDNELQSVEAAVEGLEARVLADSDCDIGGGDGDGDAPLPRCIASPRVHPAYATTDGESDCGVWSLAPLFLSRNFVLLFILLTLFGSVLRTLRILMHTLTTDGGLVLCETSGEGILSSCFVLIVTLCAHV